VPRMLSQASLRLSGWKFEGDPPSAQKCVILAWPHTSNWDGVLLVLLCRSVGLDISWMIKSDWVKGPMAPLLRSLGAVAIDRSGSHNMVEQMVERFRTTDRLALVVPPEGTRKRMPHWRSGFYHIALGANVPVVPGYLDYRRKRGGFGPPIPLTGNMRADMDQIRAFYSQADAHGRVPDFVGPIVLAGEAGEPGQGPS
jgi:1-acyl-sn-glycerol-3-phosphate acyltransferase